MLNGDTSKFYFRPAACLNNKTLNSLATSAFDGRRPILTLNFYDYIVDKIIIPQSEINFDPNNLIEVQSLIVIDISTSSFVLYSRLNTSH